MMKKIRRMIRNRVQSLTTPGTHIVVAKEHYLKEKMNDDPDSPNPYYYIREIGSYYKCEREIRRVYNNIPEADLNTYIPWRNISFYDWFDGRGTVQITFYIKKKKIR